MATAVTFDELYASMSLSNGGIRRIVLEYATKHELDYRAAWAAWFEWAKGNNAYNSSAE